MTPYDKAEEPAPESQPPAIRKDGSVGGLPLCTRCGACYKPPEPCAACGYPKPLERRPIRLMAGVWWLLKKLIFIIVLAALASWALLPSNGEPRYRRWWRDGAKPMLMKARSIFETQTILCLSCRGAKHVTCEQCGGRGTLLSKREVLCSQCSGTGRYTQRLSKTLSPCPFCNAAGKRVEDVSIPCPTCGGEGRVTCPKCRGKGQIEVGARMR